MSKKHSNLIFLVIVNEKVIIHLKRYSAVNIESDGNYLNQSIEVDATRYSLIVYKDIIGKVIIDNS